MKISILIIFLLNFSISVFAEQFFVNFQSETDKGETSKKSPKDESYANSQVFYGLTGGLLNAINKPVVLGKGLYQLLLSKNYNSYKKRSDRNLENDLNICLNTRSNNQGSCQDGVCTCNAWGSCSTKSCSCEKLCPDSFEILSITSEQTIASVDNSFVFRNHTDMQPEFDGKDLYPKANTNGYCWGHATLSQRFSRLALFEDLCSKRIDNLCDGVVGPKYSKEVNKEKWLGYYKDIIDDIFNNRARVVPGFANMRTFSEDPDIREQLLLYVMKAWRQNSMSFEGLVKALKRRTSKRKGLKLVDDLLESLVNYQTPILVVGKGVGETHVKVVWGVKLNETTGGIVGNDGAITFCLRDNNLQPETNHQCISRKSILKIGAPKEMREGIYSSPTSYRPGEIRDTVIGGVLYDIAGGVSIPTHEKRNIVDSIKSLRNLCISMKCSN